MRAAGLRLACVTNKADRASAIRCSRPPGCAGYLELVIGGDSLPSKKPDPRPLLHVAARFAVPAERLLVIGDSDNDSRAGARGRLPGGLVSYGYTGGRDVRELDVDAIVTDLVEASSLIQTRAVVNALSTRRLKWLAAGSWRSWRRLPVV